MIEFIDYLNQHPSAAEILAAVHGVKPKYAKAPKEWRENLKKYGFEEPQFMENFNQAPSLMQSDVSGLDDRFRESMQFAASLKEKMKIN